MTPAGRTPDKLRQHSTHTVRTHRERIINPNKKHTAVAPSSAPWTLSHISRSLRQHAHLGSTTHALFVSKRDASWSPPPSCSWGSPLLPPSSSTCGPPVTYRAEGGQGRPHPPSTNSPHTHTRVRKCTATSTPVGSSPALSSQRRAHIYCTATHALARRPSPPPDTPQLPPPLANINHHHQQFQIHARSGPLKPPLAPPARVLARYQSPPRSH